MTTEQDNKRNTKGQFVKGISGNPGGRNRGITSYIKERTNGFQELIDMALTMLKEKSTSKKDKLYIINMLLDRGIGKPAIFANVNTDTDIVIGLPSDLEEKDFE
jgi:hypothetical protein